MAGGTQDDVDMGVHIMIAGLTAQVVSLSVFGIICADFAVRVIRRRERHSPQYTLIRSSAMWKLLLIDEIVDLPPTHLILALDSGL